MLKVALLTLSFLFVSHVKANELTHQQREFFNLVQQAALTNQTLPSLDVFPFCYDKTLSCQTGREIFVQAVDELLQDKKITQAKVKELITAELNKDIPIFDRIHISKTFDRPIRLIPSNLDQRARDYLKSYDRASPQAWSDRYEVAKALLEDDRHYGILKLFMFCRDSREQKCLLLLKDPHGNLVEWSQKALGLSKFGKEFFETNGSTPSGVWKLESVMPFADQNELFGKYRRIIMNFIGQSPNEIETKIYLPQMTHNHTWWREAVTARDNGRGLFRIHGTGLQSDEAKPYFPLVATSGCVAQSENTYKGIEYHDQRHLLDELMMASGLEPIFENETEIFGLLYVIDIDKKEEPITIQSLQEAGILASGHHQ